MLIVSLGMVNFGVSERLYAGKPSDYVAKAAFFALPVVRPEP